MAQALWGEDPRRNNSTLNSCRPRQEKETTMGTRMVQFSGKKFEVFPDGYDSELFSFVKKRIPNAPVRLEALEAGERGADEPLIVRIHQVEWIGQK